MFPTNNIPGILIPVNDRSVQPSAPIQRLLDQLSDLVPGQRLLAEIQATLGDGVYRAIISQREVTLALPFAAKIGDRLELEVVSQQGKTTLAVISSGQQKSPSDSTLLHLSSAARTIGALITHHDQQSPPSPLDLTHPALRQLTEQAGMPDPKQLAPLLQQAVSQSGVFYEAHLLRWFRGQYPESLLRQEPQGRIVNGQPQPPSTQPPSSTSSASIAEASKTFRQNLPLDPSSNASSLTPQRTELTRGAEALPSDSGKPLVPATLSQIVEQQLATLNQPTLLWQGAAWQGQQMEWEISQDAPQKDAASADGRTPWRSRLTLHLPQLGTVEATLHLDSQRKLKIQLSTGNAGSCDVLEHRSSELLAHLTEAGLDTVGIRIAPHPLAESAGSEKAGNG